MFKDRREAGLLLGRELSSYKKKKGVVVVGIPRGGVITADEVAKHLSLPMAALVVKKIGAPNQAELAIGAVGPAKTVVLENKLIARLGVDRKWLNKELRTKNKELRERERKYGLKKKSTEWKGRTAILVDDGIATGATIEAAIKYLKRVGVEKIAIAVPVSPKDTAEKLKKLVDEAVILESPETFSAVGEFYKDFPQVIDEEVINILK